MEQAAAIDSPSSAQSGDSAAQSPKTINVLPRSPLLHIPQSVVQTLKMASKYTIIPAKGRMILLNSPVLLHRDALVEASLDAIKQSQEAGVVDMTGDQETPVFEVIQEPEKKISVYGDDTVEKTNDIDDVINDMKSKLPKSKDPKIKLVYKSISKSKSHSSDTSSFKSHSSDTATSKSHISDTATSKSHSSGTSTSKSHSSGT
ncbi:uncharacterized protein LOC110452887 [Mizuhopecten yessoensis]|uniref:uncharacterized protein LOC110452887 n=1 Tax=Mizuhopecten yessoensis TaxID=6573 RepID=UPI000B45A581|nr:uncharacterized protein LOC110452887 [Mizuhopecten yessoensis]